MRRLIAGIASAIVIGGVLAVPLASPATAAPGDFTVSPTTLSFASAFVGETKVIAVTITNASGSTLSPNFSGGAPFDADNFGVSQDCAGRTFAPGATCTFTFEFEPVSTGAKSSSTTIGIDSDNFSITMSGTAVGAFSMAPTTLAFGNVNVGNTKAIAVIVKNLSSVSQSPNFAGGAPIDPTHFGASQDCAGKTFAPGATCAFTYEFEPKSNGPKSTTTNVQIDDVTFPITMSGTGGGAAVPVSLTPTDLSFGNTPIGEITSRLVIVKNITTSPVTPVYTGGDPADSTNFAATQSCTGRTLAPGATCEFNYRFLPKSVGAKTTSATVTVDGTPFSITLSGNGVSPATTTTSPPTTAATTTAPVAVPGAAPAPGAPPPPATGRRAPQGNLAGPTTTLAPGGPSSATTAVGSATSAAGAATTDEPTSEVSAVEVRAVDVSDGEDAAAAASGSGVDGSPARGLLLLVPLAGVGALAAVIVKRRSGGGSETSM